MTTVTHASADVWVWYPQRPHLDGKTFTHGVAYWSTGSFVVESEDHGTIEVGPEQIVWIYSDNFMKAPFSSVETDVSTPADLARWLSPNYVPEKVPNNPFVSGLVEAVRSGTARKRYA